MRDHHGPRGATSRRRATASLALGLLALAAGCVKNDGVDPPADDLEFPIAAVVSNYDPSGSVGPEFLYVANSNYELAYNTGTLQTYSIEAAIAAIDADCRPDPSDPDDVDLLGADCQLVQAGSQFDDSAAVPAIEVGGLVVSEVLIGSYADGIALSPDGDRLYLPDRTDADLTHVDVDPATGELSCGSTSTCDDDHTSSDHSVAQAKDMSLPTDPVAVTVGALSELMGASQPGNIVIMSHREGAASLFVDVDPSAGSRPQLIDVLSNLPPELVTTTFDPISQLVWGTSATYPLLARVGVTLDMLSVDPLRGTLFDAGSLVVSGVDTGSASVGDTRDVAFDPRPGNDRVYVLSRRPDAIFVANRTPDNGRLDLLDLVEVGEGPSRMQVVSVDVGGTQTLLAFVSCFDNRNLYVLDLDRMELMGVVTGMSGPFELQVDVVRRLVYVVDFRVSTIRIVDLAPIFECLENPPTDDTVRACAPELLGMIGQPQASRVLQ